MLDRVVITFIVFWAGIEQTQGQMTTSLEKTEGDDIILPCSLTGSYMYPEWRGPPSLTIYTSQGNAPINPAAPAKSRLSYHSNQQDLNLQNIVTGDSGEYKCTYAGIGYNTITLNVMNRTGTTSDGSLKGWEIALIVVGVLVGVAIAVGVGIYVFKHFH